MGELDLSGKIEFAFSPGGILVAKQHVEALAAAANDAGNKFKPAGENIRDFGAKSNVARNQVAAMTAVIVRSIGFSGQAGAAARVAATAFVAMADAAQFANLKMAGVTLGLSLLIPLLVSLFMRSKEASDGLSLLGDTAAEDLARLSDYAEKTGDVNAALLQRIERLRDLAFAQQAVTVQENVEKIEKLRTIEKQLADERAKLFSVTENYVTVNEEAKKQVEALTPRWAAAQKQIAALEAENRDLNEAIKAGVVVDEQRRKSLQLVTKALEDQRQAEQRLEAVKRFNEANRKKNEEREVDRKRKEAKDEADMHLRTKLFLMEEQKQRNKDQDRQDDIDEENRRRDEEYAQFKRNTMRSLAADGLAAMSEIFAGNKAVAIAAAIADTYAAANKALAIYGPTPLGYAAMAAAIVQGLANVANIRKADAGFDDPVNDAIAVAFGRKFANDVVNLINVGFNQTMGAHARHAAGASGGGGGGLTINGGLHLGGFFGANETQLLKQLNRKLITIQRLEERTTQRRS